MSKVECVLLLGSNINDKNEYLDKAIVLIEKEVGQIIKMSNRILTEPEGFSSKELILNQKIKISTELSPIHLLLKSKSMENRLGRKKRTLKNSELYSDREIDIDIIYYSNIQFNSLKLIVPHQRNVERKFWKQLNFK